MCNMQILESILAAFPSHIFMDEDPVARLRQQLADLSDDAAAVQMLADEASRDLTAEEQTKLDEIVANFENTDAELKRRLKIASINNRATESQGRRTAPNPVGQTQNSRETKSDTQRQRQPDGLENTVLQTTQERGRWGFSHFGEFLNSARMGKMTGQIDPRIIRNSATTWGSEAVGEDGGFTVPPDWRNEIVDKIMGEESLLSRTDQQETSSNQIVYPVDETADWHTSGIRVYWTDEGATKTQSKPNLKLLTCRANKIAALIYMTDELLEDSAAMGRYVQSKTPRAINFAVNDAIINGNGAGKPLGFMNSAALVTVSKESSQVADTIVGMNVAKMWARMIASARGSAIWLINQDLEPQLMTMNVLIKNVAGTENVGGMPVYVPPGGFSQSPYATLFGRPVVVSESMSAIGDLGDIAFVSLPGYLTVMKKGGIRADTSIHVEFEKDLTAFRFVLRVGGQPWLSAPVARAHGSNTLSHFITLEAR